MKAAKAVASILKQEGVECLFCFPINQVIDAAAEVGIRPIMARTERAVIGMADGYARATNGRRVGVCTVQYGPGTENAFGGLAQAYSDSTPLLFLPGGVPEARTGVRPNFDAVLNFQQVTKWVARINRVDRISEFLRRAFTQLRVGRLGPVALELPWDVMLADVENAGFSYAPVKGTRSMADPEDVAAAVRAMVSAKLPLFHAGLGVLYAEASAELVELAELLQAPVMTTLSGKSAFPEDHPLAIGSGGMAWPRAVTRYLADADLVLGARARSGSMPLARRCTNWLSATVATRIGKVVVPDAQTGLRAFTRRLALELQPAIAGYRRYDYEAAFLLAALRGGYGVRSVCRPARLVTAAR